MATTKPKAARKPKAVLKSNAKPKTAPKARTYAGAYPFPTMKVGDSITIRNVSPEAARRSCTYFVQRYKPTWRFTIIKNGGQYKCTRTK